MKSKVRFSAYCVIVTVAVVALFLIGIVATRHQSDKCIGLSVIAVVTTLAGLFYCPMSVSTDSNSVKFTDCYRDARRSSIQILRPSILAIHQQVD